MNFHREITIHIILELYICACVVRNRNLKPERGVLDVMFSAEKVAIYHTSILKHNSRVW